MIKHEQFTINKRIKTYLNLTNHNEPKLINLINLINQSNVTNQKNHKNHKNQND